MNRVALCLFALITLVATLAAQEQKPNGLFPFKADDRVLFLGDSITEQYQYSTDLELYLTTRFPKWNLQFLNAGIGGDTANGGANRFANHVLAEKPTIVTINFGMNDARYGPFDAELNKTFLNKTEAMLEAAKKAGVRVVLMSPNAVDRRVQDRFKLYLETQKQFYAPLRELAAKHGATFVDQYALTRAALEKMEADDAKAAKVKPFGDGFHTSPPGGLLMAHAILIGLHAPGTVSDADIDAHTLKGDGKNCTIAKLECSPMRVAFDRTEEALPMPIPKDWASVLPYVNELKDLNWYGLKVRGLVAGDYSLSIDGNKVGTYSAAQLNNGVNLGDLTTGPIYEQSKKVFDAINAKNELVHQRFRGVMMFQAPDWLADAAKERKAAELAKRKAKIDELQAEVYRLAEPKTHHFELTTAK